MERKPRTIYSNEFKLKAVELSTKRDRGWIFATKHYGLLKLQLICLGQKIKV
jgi:transposase-like protein